MKILSLSLLASLSAFASSMAEDIFESPLPKTATLLILSGTALGKQIDFVIDTGASTTVLDPSFEPLFSGPPLEAHINTSSGDRIKSRAYSLQGIDVGSWKIGETKALLNSMENFTRMISPRIRGVIGWNAFAGRKALFDYDKQIFLLHDGPSKIPASGGNEISLIANSDLPEFNASIGGVEIVFLVDTGSDGSIAIPESAFDRLEKLGFIEVSPIQMKTQSLNRIRDSRRGWFLKGELMGMPLRGMDVVSSARKPSTPLGLIWLSSFNFELDRQKNTMRFEQRSNPAPAPAVQMMLGAVLIYDEEGARVFRIRPDGEGPFEKAGLKVGDRIVKFGELEASEIDLPNIGELIVRNPFGEIEVSYSREDGVLLQTVVKLEKFISTRDFSGRDVLRKAASQTPQPPIAD